MSGRKVDSLAKSFSVTSVLREAAFANTIFGQEKWMRLSKIGSKLVQSDQRSWSTKLPPIELSCFKESSGTEPTPGTTSCTVQFVRTCAPRLSVSRESLKGSPPNYFSDLLSRRVRTAISEQYERDIQIMLSSSRYIRSWWETFRVVTL